MILRWIGVLLLFAAGGLAHAEPNIQVQVSVEPAIVQTDGTGRIQVSVTIPKGFHISDASEDLFSVTPAEIPGVAFKDPVYPKGEKNKWGSIYKERVTVPIPFHVQPDTKPGVYPVQIKVMVQACEEARGVCLAPAFLTAETTIEISGAIPSFDSQSGGGIAGRLTSALERGSILAFLLVFLGGVLTSLTPCVYPMIPITIAVIGAQATGGKLKGFVLSLFYVLGISLTFSTLGVVAAKTGSLFGSFSQNPVVQAVIAGVFFLMGLSMLGAFVVQLPAGLRMKIQGKRRRGFVGAMLTGVVAGLVVSPCVSPLLVVILTWVAKSGSVLLGFGLLFTFAWGIGVLFLVLGTFSGVLKNMPKAGGWTEHIERAFGYALLVLALVFLKPALSGFYYRIVWAVFLVILGTFWGGFSPLAPDATWKARLRKAVGFILILAGSTGLVLGLVQKNGLPLMSPSAPGTEKVSVSSDFGDWLTDETAAFDEARSTGRLVLIDFFADWCAACHELDEKTWPDPAIKTALTRCVPVRIDLTKNDSRAKEVQARYKILGMPTVILLDADGRELRRFEGFQSPQRVLRFLGA